MHEREPWKNLFGCCLLCFKTVAAVRVGAASGRGRWRNTVDVSERSNGRRLQRDIAATRCLGNA
jgi:hypothetical protein